MFALGGNGSCPVRRAADPGKEWMDCIANSMRLNPSAARSLGEGLEKTLTFCRLHVPQQLRLTLASTNVIESAFSLVERVCLNVKRWHSGDPLLVKELEALVPSNFLSQILPSGERRRKVELPESRYFQ